MESNTNSNDKQSAMCDVTVDGVVPKSKTDMSVANPYLKEENERPTKKPRLATSVGNNPFEVADDEEEQLICEEVGGDESGGGFAEAKGGSWDS